MVLNIFVDFSAWVYVIAILFFLGIIIWGSARINSGFFLPVVCNGSKNEKSIAITFDDGPAADMTPRILEILKATNTPAAFFCIGKKVEMLPSIVKQIDMDGHLIGNHSYSHHFFFDLYSSTRIQTELNDTNKLVMQIADRNIRFFRPPYGVTTPNIARAVKNGSYHAIGWSVRSMDTVINDKEKLIKRTTGNLRAGDVILFHDTVELTVQVLQEFIEKVRMQGFKIVRLDQLLKLQAYA